LVTIDANPEEIPSDIGRPELAVGTLVKLNEIPFVCVAMGLKGLMVCVACVTTKFVVRDAGRYKPEPPFVAVKVTVPIPVRLIMFLTLFVAPDTVRVSVNPELAVGIVTAKGIGV